VKPLRLVRHGWRGDLNAPAALRGSGAWLSNLVPTSTEENHPLDSAAPPATILDNIAALGIGVAFLNPHRLFANDAIQEIDQGAFVVVQWTSPGPTHCCNPIAGRISFVRDAPNRRVPFL
jgi:hypothetical protein